MFQLGEVFVENEKSKGQEVKLFYALKGGIERLNDNLPLHLPWNI